MKKYYIEIYEIEEEGYILQSKLYDTKEEAIEFAKQIDYLEYGFYKDLMSADCTDDGEIGDIDFEDRLG